MCIAIVKKQNATISDEYLKNCFENNPDGAGIAYAKDGQLYYVKGIFDVKTFIDEVRKAEKISTGAMLIHCRIGTSGLKDKNNCHPHVVNDNCVMIHNGILDIDVPKGSKDSDTVIFVRELLAPLPKDFMKDEGIMNMITYVIGSGNKFCFLNGNGEYAIANEEAGDWVNDVWYSNTSYKWGRYSSWTWGKGTYGRASKTTPYGAWDYDDEWDDYYNQRYGKTIKSDYDYDLTLTDKEIEKLADVIDDLTDEELVALGEYPVYDFWTSELKNDMEYDEDGEAYLFDLDEFLGELYEDKYNDLMERVLIARTNNDNSYDDLVKFIDNIDDEYYDDEDVVEGEVVDVDYSTDNRNYVNDDELSDDEYEYIYGYSRNEQMNGTNPF